ncbi:MAG: hypothetical protein AAF680_03395 [Pseudomonadota bacterium]
MSFAYRSLGEAASGTERTLRRSDSLLPPLALASSPSRQRLAAPWRWLRYIALTIVSILSLPGCLYVELYGPVAGASITIAPLRGGPALIEGTTSYSLEQTRGLFSEEQWAELSGVERLSLMGAVDIPKDQFNDSTYYLVTASGGLDYDFDQNGVVDARGELILGEWHGIFTGTQLKGITRVSALTEAVYQEVLPELDELDDTQLAVAIDAATQRVIVDVDGDGEVDHTDLLRWSGIAFPDLFRGESFLISRLRRDVEFAFPADSLALDALQLVDRAPWFPARSEAPLAEDLLFCSSPVFIADLCTMLDFPLIGQETAQASVEQVMNRLLVSHQWMADRFEELLLQMPPMILTMMGSLTSIVIGDTVRPAYFTPATNSVYLDAEFIWLTAEERATISREPDFRTEFRSSVDFSDLARYVIDGNSVGRVANDTDENGDRTLEQLVPWTAALLFHELAHANDAIPSSAYASLSPFLAPFQQNVTAVADTLTNTAPLMSPELFGVAEVLYFGATATEAEGAYTADEIGQFFEADRANDLYSFSTPFEDLAMMVEEFMMAAYFDAYRDVAFSSLPEDPQECDDYVLAWGERNRIATPVVRKRLELVLGELFPSMNFDAQLDAIPNTQSLPDGLGWCEYLDQLNGTVSPNSADGSPRKFYIDVGRPYL